MRKHCATCCFHLSGAVVNFFSLQSLPFFGSRNNEKNRKKTLEHAQTFKVVAYDEKERPNPQ